jgi:hypothetical protein
MSALDPDLVEHYRRTEYRVADSGFAFTLRVDQPCAALLECMRHFQVTAVAYLTAWNPGSEPTADARNEAAQRALEEEIASRGWRFLYGEGVGADASWAPEPSLLVLGIPLEAACGLARKYGQNAIVTARPEDGAVPKLVLLL